MPSRSQTLRIAIDTGGTFTDCVWIDPSTKRLRMLKLFSTPADPSRAIVEAVKKTSPGKDLVLLHGTTVGTNTILERKGARTALITTQGFEDAIEIGRQARPKLYDFFFDRIAPLVPGDLRFAVNERTSSGGEILAAPTADGLRALVHKIENVKPQAIAISLLFCFANPQNEILLANAFSASHVPLSISHKILPEFREYERTSTVVINAYLQPVMHRYLQNLESQLSTATSQESRVFVMQSSGGITALATAAAEPVRTVLSGPAGGVVGAAASGRASGFKNIIGFDMGGTSTDVSLVEGEIRTANDAQIAGLPIGIPMLDIHTVGAGGGSLARFDEAGVLRVGPESAGADPGPICYGRGTQPTVTDANLLLGRLQPARFLGGGFRLDLDRTRAITGQWLKEQGSPMTIEQFAGGVIRVVNATMEKAIRVVSIERGRDPRHFALIAFGGAGGLHACALAHSLSIPTVVIPAFPGALSALGILASDVVKDHSRTVLWSIAEDIPMRKLGQSFAALESDARADFATEAWTEKPTFRRSVDVRYRGQGYELNVPFTKNLIRDFENEHKRRYGYVHADRKIELVTLRVRATVNSQDAPVQMADFRRRTRRKFRGSKLDESPNDSYVFFESKKLKARIYDRDDLEFRKGYTGPAIITEYSATTVIPPGKKFHVDKAANLIVTI